MRRSAPQAGWTSRAWPARKRRAIGGFMLIGVGSVVGRHLQKPTLGGIKGTPSLTAPSRSRHGLLRIVRFLGQANAVEPIGDKQERVSSLFGQCIGLLHVTQDGRGHTKASPVGGASDALERPPDRRTLVSKGAGNPDGKSSKRSRPRERRNPVRTPAELDGSLIDRSESLARITILDLAPAGRP